MSRERKDRRDARRATTSTALGDLIPTEHRGVLPVEYWTPMEKAKLDPEAYQRSLAAFGAVAGAAEDHEVWCNALYTVFVRRFASSGHWPAMIHLSIKRNNREAARDWRHLQRIKNEVVGPDHEAVELYPAEDRLVDGANQFHLWVLAEPGLRFPFGFGGREVNADTRDGLIAQRPWNPGEEPAEVRR